jgi:hypothetical protein
LHPSGNGEQARLPVGAGVAMESYFRRENGFLSITYNMQNILLPSDNGRTPDFVIKLRNIIVFATHLSRIWT